MFCLFAQALTMSALTQLGQDSIYYKLDHAKKIQLLKNLEWLLQKPTGSRGLKFGMFIYIHKVCNFTKYHITGRGEVENCIF